MRWPTHIGRIVLISACILIGSHVANARICGDIDIRNQLDEFETKLRNCTTIVGSLSIALIHKHRNYDFSSITFPELR